MSSPVALLDACFASSDGATALANSVKDAGAFDCVEVFDKLVEKISSDDKKQAKDRQGAMAAITAIVGVVGASSEPFILPMIKHVLHQMSDKNKAVREAAETARAAIIQVASAHSTAYLVKETLALMIPQEKWWTQVGCCNVILELADTAPDNVENCLPEIIPAVKQLLGETKAEVVAAAGTVLDKTIYLVDNRDILPLLPALCAALKDPKLTKECIHQLAGTTFVAVVTRGPLAAIVPLMVWGFREREAATKRIAAKIVGNMAKLVANQVEAMPFLPEMIPALERVAETMSDPEARGVVEQTLKQMKKIKADCEGLEYLTDFDRVLAALRAEVTISNAAVESYATQVLCSLIDNFEGDADEWVTALSPCLEKFLSADKIKALCEKLCKDLSKVLDNEEIADEDAECLCDCKFTLAYGNKILLFDTKMKLYRGMRYGLLGGNDSGKTTLMRAISKNQVEGFPDSNEVRTVFVEADIVGEQSHLTCVDYVLADENIIKYKIGEQAVRDVLVSVGFARDSGKGTAIDDGVSTLSGGWRMKLALARAMLQKADILLLDEPTNHLDVMNVKWTLDYLKSLDNVTCIIVSHDSKLLEQVTTHMLEIKDFKLKTFKGKLSEFVAVNPEAASFFELKKTSLSFKFPQPGYIEGVKSKGKALMKMEGCTFTYPGNTTPTIVGITVQVSLSSRVALLGPNGAGKSTLIKLLVGENVPDEGMGKCWKHPGCRFAYVAQHAFAHIEDHLDKTANEYIRWRYASGDDKETIKKLSLIETEDELKKQKEVFIFKWRDEESGKEFTAKRVVHHLTGERQMNKSIKSYEYKACFAGMSDDKSAVWMTTRQLTVQGWDKNCKRIDESEAAKAGMFIKPLTQRAVEQHIADVGLAPEYGTHFRLNALSGGQKVKVVLASALWNQPHILILDEPTNYLDRESLGALSNAIEVFEGGCVMITHNNEFCSALCPETWILEKGEDQIARIETKGDAEWMKKKESEAISVTIQEVVVDAAGNETAVEAADKKMDRKEKKAIMKQLKAAKKAGDDDLIAELEDRLEADDAIM